MNEDIKAVLSALLLGFIVGVLIGTIYMGKKATELCNKFGYEFYEEGTCYNREYIEE